MTTDEKIKHDWEAILTAKGHPVTISQITVEEMLAYFRNKDPFSQAMTKEYVNQANVNKDNLISKQEYDDFSRYMHQRMGSMGTRSMCNPKYDKFRAAADKAGTWTRCALSANDENKCQNDETFEWDREFRPDEEWKNIANKAGVLSTSTDQRIPQQKWVEITSQMFDLPSTKMDGFFKEADRNQDQHADQGEY